QVELALPRDQERAARPPGGGQRVQRGGQLAGAADGPHRERGLGPFHRVPRGQPGQHPVDRANLRRERGRVHQQGQAVVVRAAARRGGGGAARLHLGVRLHLQVGGVPVV